MENESKIIWRYMDFTKFIDLLENKKLYFPNLSKMEDYWEGENNSLTEKDKYNISNGEIIKVKNHYDKRGKENSIKLKFFIKDTLEQLKKAYGVSCWRIDDNENHAMWKVFLNSRKGVAIKTTNLKLKKELESHNNNNIKIIMEKIKYIDFKINKMDISKINETFFTKNIYYEHEKEFRIIACEVINSKLDIFDKGNLLINENGLNINLIPNKIIEEIIVCPYAPKWFFELVKKIVKKYNLKAEVNWSEIKLK